MRLHFTRSATVVAAALSVGLLALPACKKKKSQPTVADTPSPSDPAPPPGPTGEVPNAGGLNLPQPPRAPIFRTQNPRAAAVRAMAEKNMKDVVMAIQNFEATHGALPAGHADKTGKAGLSWRVAILPFLEQDPLFRQFKLDEAWDSPNNIKLIDKMPKQFAPPNESTYGYTFTRGFTGPNTWLPPLQRPALPGQQLFGVKLLNITDGTSNTALIADAWDAVIWTKPDEMAFSPNSVPKLGGVFESGTIIGLADGSTHLVRKNADPTLFPRLIQINDGQPVQLD
ncbi:DUF1559 domain-containing protein [Gemmata sp. JC717]|uniref:DUF1559 domain-containing protein n=1 Tax=Gemmata algarum TaxID=2975278 RepID=UPI0021BAA0AD|nr:DUF1559 domain-containing protein [Gemmata algarum]MDY3552906.1 DUF1559 domain-containing protein [Gemmata algarum]